jgi:hypothetical protein
MMDSPAGKHTLSLYENERETTPTHTYALEYTLSPLSLLHDVMEK